MFSIDFAGPLPENKAGCRSLLTCVEHLAEWPVVAATKRAIAETVIKVLEDKIVRRLGAPRVIVSNNRICFTAQSEQEYMKKYETARKTVGAYAPLSNGRAERMVGKMKRSVQKMLEN